MKEHKNAVNTTRIHFVFFFSLKFHTYFRAGPPEMQHVHVVYRYIINL